MKSNNSFISTIILVTTLLFLVFAAPHEEPEAESNEDKIELSKVYLDSHKSRKNYHDGEKANTLAGLIGKKAQIKDYPYTAAVITRTYHEGSAIILNKQWMLTSAWVLLYESPSNVLVRAGSNSAIDKGETSWASKLISHPGYTHSWENDIGLIKLKKPLKYSKNVKAIKLPNSEPKKGNTAVLSGFGYANETISNSISKNKKNTLVHDGWLRAGSFKVLPYKDCLEYYSPSYYPAFTNTSFCTEPRTDSGPCAYDYGSPLVVEKKLIGVFSGVPLCVLDKYPPVYTNVFQHIDWIKQTMKNNTHPKELQQLEADIEYY